MTLRIGKVLTKGYAYAKSLTEGVVRRASSAVDTFEFLNSPAFKKTRMTRMQRIVYNLIEKPASDLSQRLSGFFNQIDRKKVLTKGVENVTRYLANTDGRILAPVKIYSKVERKEVTAYMTIRKIDLNGNYREIKSTCTMGGVINNDIANMIKAAKRGESFSKKLYGIPKGHTQATEHTYLLEIVDEYGIPIGRQFVDITKDGIIPKNGLINYEPETYGNVGTLLNDVKSLLAELNGSRKVIMCSTDRAKAFHQRCGFIPDKTRTPCGGGDFLFMPEDSLDRIVQKYKKSELYAGVKRELDNYGVI